MSSVLRGYKESPIAQASYIVRADVPDTSLGGGAPPGLPIGSTQAAIDAGIAAARADGKTVTVIGSLIQTSPDVYLADYFNGDVYLVAGELLRDMGKEIVMSYNGMIFVRARLVTKVHGKYTEGDYMSTPFYVTTFESYGAGGFGGSDVFVTRVS